MEKLKCKVVILTDSKLVIRKGHLMFDQIFPQIASVNHSYVGQYCKNAYLYFTSNREIKEGDKGYILANDKILNIELLDISAKKVNYYNGKKIEATTDPSLNLPLIPQSFIEKYVEEQGKIDEVMIELEICEMHKTLTTNVDARCICTVGPQSVKLRKDNTVIVSKVKDSWTREEVVDLLERHFTYIDNMVGTYFMSTPNNEQWIKENL